jgi:hypothetical protein
MAKEQVLSEQDSLRIIQEMIQKAKAGAQYERGQGPILWGSVIGFVGSMSFLELYFKWNISFDWWILTLVALIPQVFIVLNDRKKNIVKTHEARAIDMVWTVFGISIFALVLYGNFIGQITTQLLADDGVTIWKKSSSNGPFEPFQLFVPSIASLHLMIYGFPTLVTGVVIRCRSMLIGACICYILFVVSLYTPVVWDMLFMGIAGICNWLIPGIILRRQYLLSIKTKHV